MSILEGKLHAPTPLQATAPVNGQPRQAPPVEAPAEADDSQLEASLAALEPAIEDQEQEPLEANEPEEETEESGDYSRAFAEEFKANFGLEVEEAVSLVGDLQNFRAEMGLMREWGVSPTEYDSRMQQVLSFYSNLPEDSRAQFNSVEGAKAIWNHLAQQQPTTKSTAKSSAKSRGSFNKPPTQKAKVWTESEILAMDDTTYRANYGEITRAYMEGRVVEK